MSKTNAAQLALLDLPAPAAPDGSIEGSGAVAGQSKDDRGRRRMSTARTAKHCNALLAELERVSLREQNSAERLAELYEAAERAHHLGRQ